MFPKSAICFATMNVEETVTKFCLTTILFFYRINSEQSGIFSMKCKIDFRCGLCHKKSLFPETKVLTAICSCFHALVCYVLQQNLHTCVIIIQCIVYQKKHDSLLSNNVNIIYNIHRRRN